MKGKGLTNLLDRVNGASGRERVRQADVDVDPDEEVAEVPYDVRLSRPWVDIGLRAGLWVAVGFGCVGGILALLGLTSREGDTLVQEGAAGGDVPAPVARVAERAIEVWLTAESEDDPLLDALFVEQPELVAETAVADGEEGDAEAVSGVPGGGGFAVGRVTTVGGGLWGEDYWVVTTAVEVAECVPDEVEGWATDDGEEEGGDSGTSVSRVAEASPLARSLTCDEGNGASGQDGDVDPPPVGEGGESSDGIGADGAVREDEPDDGQGEEEADDAGSEEEDPSGPSSARVTTLFIEVGVVGDLAERVAVLSTPAVTAGPEPVSEDWESTGWGADAADTTEPVARTVEEFLRAWLAGDGDTSRHMAPHVEAPTVDPAPFSELVLTNIAYEQDEPGETRVRAFVEGTTPGGSVVHAAYELSLSFREDRWEVSDHWGAPSLAGWPEPGEQEAQVPEPGTAGGSDGADGAGGEDDPGGGE